MQMKLGASQEKCLTHPKGLIMLCVWRGEQPAMIKQPKKQCDRQHRIDAPCRMHMSARNMP